jgi:hypothetical protein
LKIPTGLPQLCCARAPGGGRISSPVFFAISIPRGMSCALPQTHRADFHKNLSNSDGRLPEPDPEVRLAFPEIS